MPEPLPDIYDVLAGCTGFEWDAGNAPKVLARHNVEPGECEQAFFRHPFVVAVDEKHSRTELRWQALGRTLAARTLYLVFTVRGALIRVITARDMSQKERRRYAEVQTSVEADPGL
ncbi:MAG: BrnT family toxin [Gemmatimonadales bacterium]